MKYMPIVLLFVVLLGCDDTPTKAAPDPTAAMPAGDEPSLPATAEPTEVDLPNERQPYHGLVTAGQPTPEQFDKLKAAGYTAVVNLRPTTEDGAWDEQEKATRNVLLYTQIPISGPQDLTRANVEKFAQTLEQPMAKKGKVLVHCGSGNRAGAMVALKAYWVDGRSKEDALDLGHKAGLTGLEDAVAKIMDDAAE